MRALLVMESSHSPFLDWDWSGDGVDAAGMVSLSGDIAAKQSPHQVKRHDAKQTDSQHC